MRTIMFFIIVLVFTLISYPQTNDSTDLFLSIGTNFSFVDEFKVKGIYSSIQIFHPELWDRFGLDLLFAQGLISSKDSSTFYNNSQLTRVERFIDNRNVYLSASITFKHFNHFYWCVNLEARQNNRSYELRTTTSIKDSAFLPSVTITSELPTINHSFFFGLGAMLNYADNFYDLKLSFIPNLDLTNRTKNFVLRFYIQESSSRIRFGGELRGAFFRKKRIDEENAHELLLYISKSFSVQELAKLF